jgi:hypothetical protein
MGYGASCNITFLSGVDPVVFDGSKINRCSLSNTTAVLYFGVAACFRAGLNVRAV